MGRRKTPSPPPAPCGTVSLRFPDRPERQLAACTGGLGDRKLYGDARFSCATCGFFRRDGEHCYLLQKCDRCYDVEDPCSVAITIQLG